MPAHLAIAEIREAMDLHPVSPRRLRGPPVVAGPAVVLHSRDRRGARGRGGRRADRERRRRRPRRSVLIVRWSSSASSAAWRPIPRHVAAPVHPARRVRQARAADADRPRAERQHRAVAHRSRPARRHDRLRHRGDRRQRFRFVGIAAPDEVVAAVDLAQRQAADAAPSRVSRTTPTPPEASPTRVTSGHPTRVHGRVGAGVLGELLEQAGEEEQRHDGERGAHAGAPEHASPVGVMSAHPHHP